MPRSQVLAMSGQEAFMQDVEREMAAFERREKEFLTRERNERFLELLGFMPNSKMRSTIRQGIPGQQRTYRAWGKPGDNAQRSATRAALAITLAL